MSLTFHIINGPNLNLLGQREPEIYGSMTLSDIEDLCREAFPEDTIIFLQSNIEGELVTMIQEAGAQADALIINPAAYSHTSIGILDALSACHFPVLEVHVSNIHKRETFRHFSYVSQRADAVIAGCGIEGYLLALRRAATLLADA